MILNLLSPQWFAIENSPDDPLNGNERILTDSWSLDLYTGTQVTVALILLFLYSLVLIRVCRGTKYPFVIVLTILFMVSNLGGALEPVMLHKSIELGAQSDKVKEDRIQIEAYAKAHEIFYGVRLAFLNLGMWFFCFRYWNISQVMPVHLSGKEISRGRKWVTLIIFLVGSLIKIKVVFILGSFANFLMPCFQAYYDFKMDTTLSQPKDTRQEYFAKYRPKSLGFKYASGTCQLISSIFMIWAILNLYCKLGRKSNLREFVKQHMMVLMVVTYVVYMGSVAIYFSYYTMWDRKPDPSIVDKVFVWWSIAVFLIFCVQLVLITVFWSLSSDPVAPPEQTDSKDRITYGDSIRIVERTNTQAERSSRQESNTTDEDGDPKIIMMNDMQFSRDTIVDEENGTDAESESLDSYQHAIETISFQFSRRKEPKQTSVKEYFDLHFGISHYVNRHFGV